MNTSDFSTAILVDETAAACFDAINNVKGWWSEEIEGSTNKLNDEFNYHYEDVHRCKMKIIEFIPNEKVVWLVLENYFKFTKDENEWTGNKIIFEITEKNGKTQIQMTQVGLVPEYECFDICKGAWTTYIQNSLRSLITTGKGMPNGKGKPQTENEKKIQKNENQDYSVRIIVNATPEQAFKSINSVSDWWTIAFEGHSEKINDIFTVRFGETFITIQLIDFVPNKKIGWQVIDCYKHWLKDKKEWQGTKMNWEISTEKDPTQISFTHIGLVPGIECYNGCEKAWDFYVKESLLQLLTEGEGKPELK